MDIFAIIDQYGIPLAVAALFAAYIHKQESFIRNELLEEIEQNEQNGIERAKRLEGIVIGLINSQKEMQLDIKESKTSYRAIVEILASLSGNGLKEKFLNNKDY